MCTNNSEIRTLAPPSQFLEYLLTMEKDSNPVLLWLREIMFCGFFWLIFCGHLFSEAIVSLCPNYISIFLKLEYGSQSEYCVLEIPALWRLRQEVHYDFETSLEYIVSLGPG